MKKTLFWRIVLILLPMVTFGLECMPDSVSVVLESGVYTCSFFDTLPDGSQPFGMAFAGMLTLGVLALAVLFAFSKKEMWLTGLKWLAIGAATVAVLPLLLRTEPFVLPNVGVALALLMESLLAFVHKRQLAAKGRTQPAGRTLQS